MTQPTKPHDPLIETQIDRTLAPYNKIASPATLATMREQLREMLTADPLAVAMMEQFREHAAPNHSGGRPIEGANDPTKAGGETPRS